MWHRDRGLTNGVQLVILFPLAWLILLLTLQWAMVSWASATAMAAATDGARAAAALDSTPAAGRAAASAAADNGSLSDVAVDVVRGPHTTTVTVVGTAYAPLPGVMTKVTRTAHLPSERLD